MKNFPENCTVYAPDLLGYGKSDKPDICGEDFYTAHIEALRETAELLAIKKFYLAGISMGAAVAFRICPKISGADTGSVSYCCLGDLLLHFHFISFLISSPKNKPDDFII